MMPLKERIEAAISKNAQILKDPEYIRLRDFYEGVKARGGVIKKVYELPARDAWGPPARENAAEVLRVSSDERLTFSQPTLKSLPRDSSKQVDELGLTTPRHE